MTEEEARETLERDQQLLDHLGIYLKELRLAGYDVDFQEGDPNAIPVSVVISKNHIIEMGWYPDEGWVMHNRVDVETFDTLEELEQGLRDVIHEYNR